MLPRLLLLLTVVLGAVLFVPAWDSAEPGAQAQLPYRHVLPMLAREGSTQTANYQVQPGDTLRAVAHRFHASAAVIAQLNGVPTSYTPSAGEWLFVPQAPAPRTSSLVANGDRTSKRVALTLDMGGRVDPALDIMQFLIDNQVPATIFMTGAMADNPYTDAGRQVMQLVQSHLDLFELGNHSYNHPDFTTLSADAMVAELTSTQASISNSVTLETRPLWRPPFGAWDSRVLDVVGQAGWTQTIMWDIDTIDWLPESDGGPSTSAIVNKVLNNARGGSIVLMHLGGYNTRAALPAIVQGLRDRGFELVTIGEMLN